MNGSQKTCRPKTPKIPRGKGDGVTQVLPANSTGVQLTFVASVECHFVVMPGCVHTSGHFSDP